MRPFARRRPKAGELSEPRATTDRQAVNEALVSSKVSSIAPVPLDARPSHRSPSTAVGFAKRITATQRLRRRWMGLDIGTSAVKVVELSPLGESFRVEAFAIEPVPAGSVVAGNISDAGAVGEAIRNACKRAGVKPGKVCAGIRNSAVVTKTLDMDASLTDRELEAEVSLEAERHIPFPIDEVAIDFEPMHLSVHDPSKVNVLLVACRLEHVAQRQEAAALGGLRLDVVDIESHAAHHALANIVEYGNPVALANVGAATSTVTLVHGESVITREEQFDVPPDLPGQQGAVAPTHGRMHHATGLEPLPGLLTRLLRLVLLAGRVETVDRLLLAGGVASAPGFAERAAAHLDLTVEVADVFRGMAVSQNVDKASLGEHAPMLYTACGLALRGLAEARA